MMNWQSAFFRRVVLMTLVVLVGGIAVLCCVGGDLHLWMQSLGVAPWALAFATALRLFAAMALAVTFATCLKLLHPPALREVTFWLGKALAFFPVNLLAWSFLGLWIGQLGHPIWTLMPVTEPESSLSIFEAWARWTWSWIPVVGLISVPLTGQCMSLSLTLISLLLAAVMSVSQTWVPERMDSKRWAMLLLSSIFKISAWCLSGYVFIPSLWAKPPSGMGMPGLISAFDDPAAVLYSGLPWMSAALFVWALGHFMRPR